jgi:hypothetical protein
LARLGRGGVASRIFYFVIAGLDPAIHGSHGLLRVAAF